MRFCDFLNVLHDNTSYTLSQSQFILELFSALCGEENPCKANNKNSFSNTLPEGLCSDDPKYRCILYNGNNTRYNGLSHIIKTHIRANSNKETFLAYLETVYKNKIGDLCDAFGVTKIIKKATIFEGIYEQFMDYATDDNDDATFKLKNVSPKDDKPFEEIFNDAIRELGVESFLESDPTESLSSHFLNDMERFVGKMRQIYDTENALKTKLKDARKAKHENTFIFNPEKSSYKDEKTSRKMFEFSETLFKYVRYLKKRMNLISTEKVNHDRYVQERYEMPEASYTKYKPPKDNKNFGRYSLKYRNNLKSLYDEIQTLQQK